LPPDTLLSRRYHTNAFAAGALLTALPRLPNEVGRGKGERMAIGVGDGGRGPKKIPKKIGGGAKIVKFGHFVNYLGFISCKNRQYSTVLMVISNYW